MCAAASHAAALFAHVHLLLAAFGGAALATSARLKWDPTTYMALRELFPAEYRAAAAGLAAGGALSLLLAHAALLALAARGPRLRRALLLLPAAGAAALLLLELGAVALAWQRAAAWLQSDEARELAAAAAELQDHLRPLLAALARWHPLPDKLKDLIDEAQADAPRNGYVFAAALALLLLLQLTALLLALLLRARTPHTDASTDTSNGVLPHERALLKPSLTLR